MDDIDVADVPALMDGDSFEVDHQWDENRFPNRWEAARQSIWAMNILQTTRYGLTTQDIVDYCVDFHVSYLPEDATNILKYIANAEAFNPSSLFDLTLTDQQFQALNYAFRRNQQEFFEAIDTSRWIILPIAANGHFSVVIIRTKRTKKPGTKKGFRTDIQNIVVADPQKHAHYEKLIFDRLKLILTPRRGFKLENEALVDLWFPKQKDTHTCGFRIYEIIRVMMMRISKSAAEEGCIDGYNPDTIWERLSGDFQPDKVRAEMIGILANRALQYTHWSTRLCLVPVKSVKSRELGVLENTRVPTIGYGARLTALPKRNNIQYSENTIIDWVLQRLTMDEPPEPMETSPDMQDFGLSPTPVLGNDANSQWQVRDPVNRPQRETLSPQSSPPALPGAPETLPNALRNRGNSGTFVPSNRPTNTPPRGLGLSNTSTIRSTPTLAPGSGRQTNVSSNTITPSPFSQIRADPGLGTPARPVTRWSPNLDTPMSGT